MRPAKTGRLARCWGEIFVLSLLIVCLVGCGPTLSSPEEVARFKKAGSVRSEPSFALAAQEKSGPYRVIPGDVLEFQMHTYLRVVSSELSEWLRPSYGRSQIEPYMVRVSDVGRVTLPVVGEMDVCGRTVAEVEQVVKRAYYPKYVVNPPMLVCQVKEYIGEHERVFTVMGLVNKPSAYPYPADVEYNLTEALAFAGGLDMVADPQYVRVFRQDADGTIVNATFKIGEEAFADACDVMIKPGDVISVDHTTNTRINKFLSDIFHITVGGTAGFRNF